MAISLPNLIDKITETIHVNVNLDMLIKNVKRAELHKKIVSVAFNA